MEEVRRFPFQEQARNAAIDWLVQRGAHFGQHQRIEIGRLGTFEGAEVGVSARTKPYWRLRLSRPVTSKSEARSNS